MQKDTCSIKPTCSYPKKWERKQVLVDGRTIVLRPVKPEDESIMNAFIQKSDPEDVRQRLFQSVRNLPHDTAVLFTQIDYEHTMVFVAIDEKNGELLGMVHLLADSNYTRAEYAVMTRSDVKKQGIGSALTRLLVDYAKEKGIGELWGQVMRDNAAMLKICKNFGIHLEADKNDPMYLVASLSLHEKAA